jgi:outer membrane receptor protein involved in Fe transport
LASRYNQGQVDGQNISSLAGAACEQEYSLGIDAVSAATSGALNSGFDPSTAPNGGYGFDKDLSGNRLPNAPPFTVSFGAQYSIPVTEEWAATLRGDYYWQDYSWARVFNDNPYDRLRGYTNVNFALILTNADGWQAMGYVKNVFNATAITGAFLYSDDTDLTTNVFTTDPRLFGVRITKNW